MACSVFLGCATESLPIASRVTETLQPYCQVKVWDEPGSVTIPGMTFAHSLRASADKFDFAIFICTAEAEVRDRGRISKAPRANLLIEIGAFIHAIGPERTLILLDGAELPSDLNGLTYIPFDVRRVNEKAVYRGTNGNTNNRPSPDQALKQIIERIKALGPRTHSIEGKRLFQHAGYYPIGVGRDRRPYLDKAIFIKAMRYLMHEHHDRLAAEDLVYLREANRAHSDIRFSDQEETEYHNFLKFYAIEQNIKSYKIDHERIFRNAIKIVNDLGLMLKGCGIEILIHDVRNPLRSIVVAQNSEEISGRKKHDPSTRFVLEYLYHQGEGLIEAFDADDLVSYLKQFEIGKTVKATTIPLYDERYGLVGIVCANIDTDLIEKVSHNAGLAQEFFRAFVRNSGYTPRFEQVNLESFPVGSRESVTQVHIPYRTRFTKTVRRFAKAAYRLAASLLF